MKSFSGNLLVSRQKLELFYSVALLLMIPGFIVVNTLVLSSSVRNDFDTELRKKADLANILFGSGVAQNLEDQQSVQSSLDDVIAARDDIRNVVVAVPDSQGFRILASGAESERDTLVTNVQYQLVIDRQQSVAQLVNRSEDQAGRSWNVVSPIKDSSGQVVALTSMDVSIVESEEAIAGTLRQSFLVLFITVFIVALMLVNHFKFVEYAQLFQKVKEADQLKTDFLSVATHELKAPMSIVKGQVSNVIDGMFGDLSEDAKKQLHEAITQTDRLNNLVQDLLNVSRIEQGKITYSISSFAPSTVIDPLVHQYKEKAEKKGIKISYEGVSNDIEMRADKDRYQEILTNLIDNAVKYSESGSVIVRHEVKPKTFVTRVKDSGIGMSTKERARLFQRFYRVKNDKTKGIGGTGLGLWIIKQYVEQMNGSISVDSLEGVGTEFIVELPRT